MSHEALRKKPGPKPGPWQDQFWTRVDKKGPWTLPLHRRLVSRCWIWTGHVNDAGYGDFSSRQWEIFRNRRAHRLAYELLIGPIPDGLTLDHLCRNRLCVRPSHLEPVPIGVNVLRGDTVSARHTRKTHCPEGHEYTSENTRWERKPYGGYGRHCRKCQDIRNQNR